jgi:hypothetical protein
MNRKADGPYLGRDRYNNLIWTLHDASGAVVRRGKSLWMARWWLFRERRRGR